MTSRNKRLLPPNRCRLCRLGRRGGQAFHRRSPRFRRRRRHSKCRSRHHSPLRYLP